MEGAREVGTCCSPPPHLRHSHGVIAFRVFHILRTRQFLTASHFTALSAFPRLSLSSHWIHSVPRPPGQVSRGRKGLSGVQEAGGLSASSRCTEPGGGGSRRRPPEMGIT